MMVLLFPNAYDAKVPVTFTAQAIQIGPRTEILHGNLNRFQARGYKKCVHAKGMHTLRSGDVQGEM